MNIASSLNKISNPNLVLLLVDREGVIREVSPDPEHVLLHSRSDLVGRPLRKYLKPLGKTTDTYIKLSDLPENMSCPPELFVQISHPSFVGEYGIFQYSFSSWFTKNGKKYSLVSLAPHSQSGPNTLKFLALHHSENIPSVLLDSRFRIVSYNQLFHEILNFMDQDLFFRKSIIPLLSVQYQTPNPFLNKRMIAHIREIGQKQGEPWKYAYDTAQIRRPLSLKSAGININNMAHWAAFGNALVFKKDDTPAKQYPDGGPIIWLPQQVNSASQDIEIMLSINSLRPCSFTLVLGRPPSNKHEYRFTPAYGLDLDVDTHVRATFLRHSAELFSGAARAKKAVITFRRTGAYFEALVNGERIGDYADPQPIFGNRASHLVFFIWTGELEINALTIKTRPTAFNFEEMAEQEPHIIEFSAAPGKLFKFASEPVNYRGKESALAVRLYQVPSFSKKNKKDYYLSLFENAREHITKNYYRSIDLKSLARQCCVTYLHFIQKFKSLFGATPKAYQTEVRLKEAQVLLKSGKIQIQDVGASVGFDDPNNFQKIFKKHFKCSPGEFARKGH